MVFQRFISVPLVYCLLTLQVVRPSCPYCWFHDSCVTACTKPRTVTCGASDVFCGSKKVCEADCGAIYTRPTSFNVIHSVVVTITQLGWNYEMFDYETLPVEPGDRVGLFLHSTGRIAQRGWLC